MAFFVRGENRDANFGAFTAMVRQKNFRADARAFSGAHHGPPIVAGIFFEQQNFKRSARFRIYRVQACRNDPRVVEHEHIAALKNFQNVTECFVFQKCPIAVQHQQSRGVACGGGQLSDEFFGEIKFKISDAHCREYFRAVNKLATTRQGKTSFLFDPNGKKREKTSEVGERW